MTDRLRPPWRRGFPVGQGVARDVAFWQVSSGGSGLRAGDLVSFGSGGRVSHVAIYAGGGRIIEPPFVGGEVREGELAGRDEDIAARGVLPLRRRSARAAATIPST